jgi:hypothetical protein
MLYILSLPYADMHRSARTHAHNDNDSVPQTADAAMRVCIDSATGSH